MADSYLEGARRGIASAIAALEGPDWPAEIDYLRDWFYELDATRGVDMSGMHPFTYPQVEAWARLTDRDPSPREVEALFTLDAAARDAALGATGNA